MSENLILIIENHVSIITELIFPYTMKLCLKKMSVCYDERKSILISITLQDIKKFPKVLYQSLNSVSK